MLNIQFVKYDDIHKQYIENWELGIENWEYPPCLRVSVSPCPRVSPSPHLDNEHYCLL
ncbi:MAG: hypothetical protein F6K47_16925 [Symploca sp. SIO2E6]|nr:hypothetical protein [Symploca sp. SIO2E6]